MYIKSLYSAQYTIVYSHANAEDISQLFVDIIQFHRIGDTSSVVCLNRCTVMLCVMIILAMDETRQHCSLSIILREPLSEQAIKKTGVRVVEYLVNSLRIEPERIVLYYSNRGVISRFGHSLGSAVSLYTAVYLAEKSNIRVGGVILQSCFTSIYRVVSNFRTTSTHDLFPSCDLVHIRIHTNVDWTHLLSCLLDSW